MENKSIQVISVCTIFPATYKPSHPVPTRIDLTPWDLQFMPFPPNQRGLLFDTDLAPDLLHRLKDSLSWTLDFFYPLAGQICSIEDFSKDASLFYIECNNKAGVKFTHAVTDDVTMADVLQLVYDPSVRKLLFDTSCFNCDSNRPFLSVQVTMLANGGFFLGCVMDHVFADGNSFWHILNSWSEICRGNFHSPKNIPVLERHYPGQTQIWIPKKFILKPPPLSAEARLISAVCQERIFIFPKEKLTLLKQKAIEESGIQSISTLQALISFIWKLTCRYRYRQANDVEEAKVLIPIGVRSRILEPPCPSYYLGNATHPAIGSIKMKELRSEDALGRAASVVHKLVMYQSEAASGKEFITSWIENPSKGRIEIPKMGYILIVASSPRFDVYGNDFGWGRPVAVRSGSLKEVDGKIVLFEGVEKGSVHMELCLTMEAMNQLEKDQEFLDFVEL